MQCAQSKPLQVHIALHWINSMMAHSSDFLLSHIFKSDCPVVVTAIAAEAADTCCIWACDAAYFYCCCCYSILLLSMTSIPKLKRIALKFTCMHCLQCKAHDDDGDDDDARNLFSNSVICNIVLFWWIRVRNRETAMNQIPIRIDLFTDFTMDLVGFSLCVWVCLTLH